MFSLQIQFHSSIQVENGGESTDTPNQDKRIIARTYGLYWTESGVALPADVKPKCISLYASLMFFIMHTFKLYLLSSGL